TIKRTGKDTKELFQSVNTLKKSKEVKAIVEKYNIKLEYDNNPLWELQNSLYDVNWNMPVEPFHLLIIGLIPWHISYILDNIFSAKEYDLFVSKYNSYKTKYNLPALKGMRRWQGDDWIKVFPFILFIFKE